MNIINKLSLAFFLIVATLFSPIFASAYITWPTPNIETLSATNIESSSARLNGRLSSIVNSTGNCRKMSLWFEYGTNASYGKRTTGDVIYMSLPYGGYYDFNEDVSNLAAGQTYHFRAVVKSLCSGKIIYGGNKIFTTQGSVPVAPTVDIKANNSNGSITIGYNGSANLSWTSTNANTCYASGGWSGTKSTSGSQSTGSLTSTRTYTINCTGPGGSVSDSVTVNVEQQQNPPTVDIKANNSNGPITIGYNSSANLSWTSTNANTCYASGNWSGTKSVGGSQSTGSLTSTRIYTINCTGPGGSVSDSVTVNVEQQQNPPTVDIKANNSNGPITIGYNSSANLSWTSTNANTCYASGNWSGTKSVGGSQSTGSLTSTRIYTINCTGPGGSVSDSVTVNVEQQQNPPTVDIKANNSNGPITIGYNSSANLSWTSTNANTCYASGSWSGTKSVGGSQSTGSLTSTRIYTINCTGPGGSVSDSVTVNVEQQQNPPTVDIKANNSNGPITIGYNSSANLSWTSTNANTCYASGNWSGTKSVGGSQSTGSLTSTRIYTINCTGPGGSVSDSVTVNVEQQQNPPTVDIKANNSNGPITIGYNSSANLSWTSTNANTCYASGSWSGTKSVGGSQSTGSLTSTRIYTINCTGPGGSVSDSVTVNVEQQQNPPTVDIKANNSNGPITIGYNSSANLSWTSTNANTCYASGSWSGTKSVGGSQSTGSLTSTRTYTINCTGPGGSVSDSVTVNVEQQQNPPTVDIKANNSNGPITIGYNSSANLSWTSTNANTCYASGSWSGTKSVGGSQSTGSLTSTRIYTINCTGPGGSVSDSVTVNVEQQQNPPTVDIKANNSNGPITIGYNSSANLSWTSTNANTCYASGSWSGTKSVGGSQSTGSLTSTRTYTINCTGAGGSVSDSVTVNVEQQQNPPTVDIKANNSNGPITIGYNSSANLSWTSTNANTCYASGSWSGTKSVGGSQSTGSLTSTRIYTINCTGPGGSVSDSVTVNVEQQQNPPTVDIKANNSNGPITIGYNSSANLSWTSTNANTCYASGNWSGTKSVGGSQSTGSLTSTRIYTINCTGPGGSVSDSVTVNVEQQQNPPIIPVFTINKLVKNYSDGTSWVHSVSADPGETLYFRIKVIGDSSLFTQNVIVQDTLPDNLIYIGDLKIDDVSSNGNIFSGLDIGDLAIGQTKRIDFKVQVAESDQFVFGETTLINTVLVYNFNSSITDTASIVVNKKQVAGAATEVSTGLTNNILLDSFFLPLSMALSLIWFLRSRIIVFEKWLTSRRKECSEYKAKKILEMKVGQIKASEKLRNIWKS